MDQNASAVQEKPVFKRIEKKKREEDEEDELIIMEERKEKKKKSKAASDSTKNKESGANGGKDKGSKEKTKEGERGGDKDKDKSKERGREKEKERGRDRDKERDKSADRGTGSTVGKASSSPTNRRTQSSSRDRGRGFTRDRNRDRSRSWSRSRSRSPKRSGDGDRRRRNNDSRRTRSYSRSYSRSRSRDRGSRGSGRDRERGRDRPRSRNGGRSRSRSSSRSRSRSRGRNDMEKTRSRSRSRSNSKSRDEKKAEVAGSGGADAPRPRRSRFSEKNTGDTNDQEAAASAAATVTATATATAATVSAAASLQVNPPHLQFNPYGTLGGGAMPTLAPVPSLVIPPQVLLNAVPKESRELFVGNVPTVPELGVTPPLLVEFFNGAMKQMKLATTSEDPVTGCRLNTKFCFIEFRSVEDCSNALNLNGIPFLGQFLKISRPAKYAGPITIAKTWQELTGQPALVSDVAGAASAAAAATSSSLVAPGGVVGAAVNPVLPAGMGGGIGGVPGIALTSGLPDPATKTFRELFVGNTSPDMTDVALKEFLGGALIKMGMTSGCPEGPIVNIRVNSKFSFVEFRTKEDAANALNLNGVPFMNMNLKISRPTKFPPQTAYTFFSWDDLLAQWMTGNLKLMTSGTPTKILRLSNMVTPADLEDDEVYSELIEETKEECSQFGTVANVIVPRPVKHATGSVVSPPGLGIGQVFVEMATLEEAKAAMCVLKGRLFDGRIVDAKFYPSDDFQRGFYGRDLPTYVVTMQGPALVDNIHPPNFIIL